VNAKVEESQSGSALDTAKWVAAIAVLIAGIYAFYHFDDQPGWIRTLGMLAVFGLTAWLASLSERGKGLLSFLVESRNEVRKVVWPTRQETMQTTLVVLVVVVIISIFLFLIDTLLGLLVQWLLGS
jgi:preprotein translocase subunit SecE